MLAIVTSFSARLYGQRSQRFKKKVKELIEKEPPAGSSYLNGNMAKAIKTIKVKILNPNKGKEAALHSTVEMLNSLLATYIDFTLQNRSLLAKTIQVVSKKTGEVRIRKLNNLEILTEVEKRTLSTLAHPETEINVKTLYPNLPTLFRRSAINTSTGMCKSYLSNLSFVVR